MTQHLKCYAPDAFSGAKFQELLENGHKIDVGKGLRVPIPI